jgi:hypothetical protein
LDRAVIAQMGTFARNFLTTSQCFEPYIPNSQQNMLYALTLLGNLGDIAKLSLEVPAPKVEAAAPARPVPKPLAPTVPSRPGIKDASILEALTELRNSNRLLNRSSGGNSSILRAKLT